MQWPVDFTDEEVRQARKYGSNISDTESDMVAGLDGAERDVISCYEQFMLAAPLDRVKTKKIMEAIHREACKVLKKRVERTTRSRLERLAG